MVVTRPLTAWETPVVWPLGMGEGPSGPHGANKLGGSGETGALGDVGPVGVMVGSGAPAAAASRNSCSRCSMSEIAPFRRAGSKSGSMSPRKRRVCELRIRRYCSVSMEPRKKPGKSGLSVSPDKASRSGFVVSVWAVASGSGVVDCCGSWVWAKELVESR